MSKKQSIVAITFGALLVMSAAFAPIGGNASPVQTAEAQDWVDTCYVGPVMVIDSPALTGGKLCPQAESDINELQGIETLETKKNIYNSISTQRQNNKNFLTSINNYLNDTSTIAKMEGKQAYIRALENGESESVARNKARSAISNYYSVKQKNLIATWNTSVSVFNSTRSTAEQTSDIQSTFVTSNHTTDSNNYGDATYQGVRNKQIELTNSSTVSVSTIKFDTGSNNLNDANLGPSTGTFSVTHNSAGGTAYVEIRSMHVKAPNDNFEPLDFITLEEFSSRWKQIKSQNNNVQSQVGTFINNTYDSYQQGKINSSDLVDPYLGARNYDPQNGSSWALRSLTAMGLSPPENVSITREMVVSQNGNSYTGILMSDGLPESNSFTIGNTYNASNLTGHQFIALSNGGTHELNGEFTLESVETTSGDQMAEGESVTYETVNYDTASTEEYQELQSQLDLLSQQLNERQEVIYAGGGGGAGSNLPSIPAWLQEKYFDIPLYGIILTGLAGVYVINSLRGGS